MSDDLTPWSRLQPAPGEVGAWVGEQAGEWGTPGGVTTTSFEAYAVLPNGTEHASLSFAVAEALRRVLRGWTADGEPCVQALWNGYGEMGGGFRLVREPRSLLRRVAQRVAFPGRPRLPDVITEDMLGEPIPMLFSEEALDDSRFEAPHRIYHAFHATLDDLAPRPWNADDHSEQSPTIFWPQARTWLVASEIDLAVTFVGGPATLIEQVVADPALFARPIDVDASIDPTWDLDYPFNQD